MAEFWGILPKVVKPGRRQDNEWEGEVHEWSGPLGQGAPPDSKVHGAHMGPLWGRQDPGGPHIGPMNLAIWASSPW